LLILDLLDLLNERRDPVTLLEGSDGQTAVDTARLLRLVAGQGNGIPLDTPAMRAVLLNVEPGLAERIEVDVDRLTGASVSGAMHDLVKPHRRRQPPLGLGLLLRSCFLTRAARCLLKRGRPA
jgi:hypothetical protein